MATLASLLDPKNIKELDSILEYHVISGDAVYAEDLKAFQHVKTLQGQQLRIDKVDATVYVQNAKVTVTKADLGAVNGVVHVIDGVLMPPTKNIVQLAVATPTLSTLVTALKAGKLVAALSAKGPFTVFAPTNEAFAALPMATLASLLDPKNIKELDSILEYHVISGDAVYTEDLQASQDVATLEEQKLQITKVGASVTVQNAKVTMANVEASNGVVHVIDGVLMPDMSSSDSKLDLYGPVPAEMVKLDAHSGASPTTHGVCAKIFETCNNYHNLIPCCPGYYCYLDSSTEDYNCYKNQF